MILRCPSCDARIRLQDELAGKKTRCPHCQEVFEASPPEEADVAEAVVVDVPRSSRPHEPLRKRPRRDDDERDYDVDNESDLARRRSMPGSVIVAVIAMGAMLAMELTLSVLVLALGNLPPDRLGALFGRMAVSVVLGGLVLWGLIVGHRLAWQWGRILGLLGAILLLLGGILSLTAGPPQNNSLAKFIIAGISLFVSACLFTIVFSLASRSAKIYFALRCPECGNFTSAAADFFFNKAKCKKCGEIW
jgi:predicted Zn finger-like uncharacterized protein